MYICFSMLSNIIHKQLNPYFNGKNAIAGALSCTRTRTSEFWRCLNADQIRRNISPIGNVKSVITDFLEQMCLLKEVTTQSSLLDMIKEAPSMRTAIKNTVKEASLLNL